MGVVVLQQFRLGRSTSSKRARLRADANSGEQFEDAIAIDQREPEGSGSDAGMSTVEYAVGTVVAAAFAAVLYKIVTGDSVIAGLTNLINSALSTSF
jgi:hypothetical protein